MGDVALKCLALPAIASTVPIRESPARRSLRRAPADASEECAVERNKGGIVVESGSTHSTGDGTATARSSLEDAPRCKRKAAQHIGADPTFPAEGSESCLPAPPTQALS